MKKLLIVIDYQKDFVDGALGFERAKDIESHILKRVQEYQYNQDEVIYTLDTHTPDYLDTVEGEKLPVEHCIESTEGWELYGEVKDKLQNCLSFKKATFPSLDLAYYLEKKEYESITIVGVVSHICVLSNAVMVKSAQPDTPIYIDTQGIASYDDDLHQKALDILSSLHCEII